VPGFSSSSSGALPGWCASHSERWSAAGVADRRFAPPRSFAGLLIFGGETIERFHLRLGSEGAVTADYRWLIFRDAWAMIKSSPWVGPRVGKFRERLRPLRDASRGF
jgi:hypothetical protein